MKVLRKPLKPLPPLPPLKPLPPLLPLPPLITMKNQKFLYLLLLLPLLLSSCTGFGVEPTAIPTITLDNIAEADSPAKDAPAPDSSGESIRASAMVVPQNSVQLSFPLTGRIEAVDVQVGDQVKVGDTIAQLETAILQASLDEATASIMSAEYRVRYLKRSYEYAHEDIAAAEAEVERKQSISALALERLNQATLKTPIAGTIVSIDIAVGETVTPGLIVVTIGDLSKMQVETTDLGEKDVPNVKIGQKAEVIFEALNKKVTGEVSEIATQANTLGGDVVYTVTIHIDTIPENLRWGMSAEVEIMPESEE